jgi:acetyl esterase/lipase
MSRLLLSLLAICLVSPAPSSFSADEKKNADPETILLWPKGAPGALGDAAADKPSIAVYLPAGEKNASKENARATAAVVVCPGGGYGALAMDHEGKQIAEWLNERGVAAFILKYRLGPKYHHPAPLNDVQRALRLVRSRAREWNVDAARVGVWGFSAGGHLASTAATHFDDGDKSAADPIDKQGCRPDFAILCYPVISMQPPHAHMGSRNNLLGKEPDPKLVESLCNEKQVTDKTPPTFLFHTKEDKAVPIENSQMFYDALKKHNVPAELVVFEKGPHGVGLAKKDPVLSKWPEKLDAWLKERKVIDKR